MDTQQATDYLEGFVLGLTTSDAVVRLVDRHRPMSGEWMGGLLSGARRRFERLGAVEQREHLDDVQEQFEADRKEQEELKKKFLSQETVSWHNYTATYSKDEFVDDTFDEQAMADALKRLKMNAPLPPSLP